MVHVTDLRSPYLNRAVLTSAREIVATMADDFLLIHTRLGCVDSDDLQLLGWRRAQINLHGRDAREAAIARSIKQSGPAWKPRASAA